MRRTPGLVVPPAGSFFDISDFSGGLNLRDAPHLLKPNESPDIRNLTFGATGELEKRMGWKKLNDGAMGDTQPAFFYWNKPGLAKPFFFQASADLKVIASSFAVAGIATVHTFSTADLLTFCEFNGKLVGVHPVDGVWDYDGTTFTIRAAGVLGTCITAWQNKVWVAGDPSNVTRVWWSNAGTSATWTTASDFVDIREPDDGAIKAIGGGSGMDVAGRPGLLVFKRDTVHRINSSTTGAFTTIGHDMGADTPNCVGSLGGVVASIGQHGVFLFDENDVPRQVSSRISPLFATADYTTVTRNQTAKDTNNNASAVGIDDRFYFSIRTTTMGDWLLEYVPSIDAWTRHQGAISSTKISFGAFAVANRTLYAIDPIADNALQITRSDSATDPSSTAVAGVYQSGWLIPKRGSFTSIARATFRGRSAASSAVWRKDYSEVDLSTAAASFSAAAAATDVVGSPVDIPGPGPVRAVALRITDSDTTSIQRARFQGGVTTDYMSSFALYGLRLEQYPMR